MDMNSVDFLKLGASSALGLHPTLSRLPLALSVVSTVSRGFLSSSKHSGPGATRATVLPMPQSVGIQTPQLWGEPGAPLPGQRVQSPCDAVRFSGHLPQGGSTARSPRRPVWGQPGPQAPASPVRTAQAELPASVQGREGPTRKAQS